MKDRVWARINHWLWKYLSKVGKETLVKSCAQAISSYCMSVYLLLVSLEDQIQKIMNGFWWGNKKGVSKRC